MSDGTSNRWDFGSSTAFVRLKELRGSVSSAQLRFLLWQYCRHTLEIMWYHCLEDTDAFFDLYPDPAIGLQASELPEIREEVEYCLGEMCFSLNELAAALRRALDETPLTVDDTAAAITHIWEAALIEACPDRFFDDEDAELCRMIGEIKSPQSSPNETD